MGSKKRIVRDTVFIRTKYEPVPGALTPKQVEKLEAQERAKKTPK